MRWKNVCLILKILKDIEHKYDKNMSPVWGSSLRMMPSINDAEACGFFVLSPIATSIHQPFCLQHRRTSAGRRWRSVCPEDFPSAAHPEVGALHASAALPIGHNASHNGQRRYVLCPPRPLHLHLQVRLLACFNISCSSSSPIPPIDECEVFSLSVKVEYLPH